MTQMKILSKAQKDRAIIDSLFKPVNGQTLAGLPSERFDLGKYRSSCVGHDVPAHMVPYVHLVWCERRKDSDGPYFALFAISSRKPIAKATQP